MRAHSMLVGVVVASLGACTDPLPDIEGEQTVTQGIYGQLVSGCDTTDCTGGPAEGIPVFLFSARPTSDTQTFDASVRSNARGLFELPVSPGAHVLCRGYYHNHPAVERYFFGPCIDVDVPTGSTRRDWASGPGGGRWWPGENFFVDGP